MQGRIRNNLLEMTMNYTVKMDNKYSKDKEKRLRQLARKNYLPAIKEYIKMLSPRMQKSYLIRAAILKPGMASKRISQFKIRGMFSQYATSYRNIRSGFWFAY